MKKRKPSVEYAALLNEFQPRVIKLERGKGRRDLKRFSTRAEAESELLARAERHLKTAKRMLAKIKRRDEK
jgi:hypothetical protein